MPVPVQCAFCNQQFDFDPSGGGLLADCPHCGKSNTVAVHSDAAPGMTVQHGAPNLSGAKPCPSCKTQVGRDAVICIHCGYHFSTGRKVGAESWFARNRFAASGLLAGAIFSAGLLAFVFWPDPPPPPPPPTRPAPPPPPAPALAPSNTPAPAAKPLPPPTPSPEEIAAQKAESERLAREAEAARLQAERDAFIAKKAQAEQKLRQQLDAREPLFKVNEPVELRHKNGVIDKGTFSSLSGAGTNRVALVATPTGEIGVPLSALDNPTRRRIDPDYREAFIQHLMSTRGPQPPAQAPAP